MEAIGEISKRLVERARHNRETLARKAGTNDLPTVQSRTEEENRSMSERDRNAGRRGVALLALRLQGRRVL